MNLVTLYNQISSSFNLSELEDLCFRLGIQYQNIAGDTLEAKARGLVEYCNRRGLLSELIKLCEKLRPNAVWLYQSEEPIDCIVLCGGYAKRLWPLTEDFSKVLLPVAGKPVLSYVLDFVQQSTKIQQVFLSVNQQFASQVRNFLDAFSTLVPITIIEDPKTNPNTKLGPVGALNHIAKREKLRDILVLTGDNLFEFKLDEFLKFAFSNDNSSNAVFRYETRENMTEYGVVKLDEDGKFVDFREKEQIPIYRDVSTGCYFFRKRDVDMMPRYFRTGGDADSLGSFLKWLTIRGNPLSGFVFYTHWHDIGIREKLIDANSRYLIDSLYANIEGDTRIVKPVQIAKGTTIRDSTIGPNVVIETGVTVRNSTVRDSIIMENTVIDASSVKDSVIGPHSRIEGWPIFEKVCGPGTKLGV